MLMRRTESIISFIYKSVKKYIKQYFHVRVMFKKQGSMLYAVVNDLYRITTCFENSHNLSKGMVLLLTGVESVLTNL